MSGCRKGLSMSADEIEAFKAICHLEAREGKDVAKVVASVKTKELDRSIELSKLLVPDSLSYFLVTFVVDENNKRGKAIASKYGVFYTKTNKMMVAQSEDDRIAAISELLAKQDSLCSVDDIKNVVWNDKEKSESSGTFTLETEIGVTLDCSFKAKRVKNKLRIYEVSIEPVKTPIEKPVSGVKLHELEIGAEVTRSLRPPSQPVKIVDLSWKVNGLTLAQREALDDISRIKCLTSENPKVVFTNILTGAPSGIKALESSISPESFTYILLKMKAMIKEDSGEIYGRELNEVKVPYEIYALNDSQITGAAMASLFARRLSLCGIDEANALSISDFKNVIWENGFKEISDGSFALDLGFGLSMDCLFRANNQEGKLQIDKVYICSRKEPKSFKKAICIIDRTK